MKKPKQFERTFPRIRITAVFIVIFFTLVRYGGRYSESLQRP